MYRPVDRSLLGGDFLPSRCDDKDSEVWMLLCEESKNVGRGFCIYVKTVNTKVDKGLPSPRFLFLISQTLFTVLIHII